jgi:hypothetical protein
MALGVVIMIIWNIAAPKYFGGSTLREDDSAPVSSGAHAARD